MLPYVVLVRIYTLLHPTVYVATLEDSVMSQMVFSYIQSPIWQSILAIVLIFFQAIAINKINTKNRIALKITLLSGVWYILLVSFLPEYLQLSPMLIANTFIIWSIAEIFSIYKKHFTAINLFNVGLSLGIATLFVPSLSIFLIFGFLGLMIIKSFSIIDALQELIGFVAAIYLFYSIYYLLDGHIATELTKYIYSFNISPITQVASNLSLAAIVVSLFVLALVSYNGYLKKKSIQAQKKIDLLFWAMALSIFVTTFATKLEYSLVLVMFVPASILLNMSFLSIKNDLIGEILHLGLLIMLFVLHFGVI